MSINKNKMTDFIREVIIEEIFAPCVVYSVNDCADEIRNNENNEKKD